MNMESENRIEQRVSEKGRHSWRMTEDGRSQAASEWENLRLRAGGNESSWMTMRSEVDGYFKALGEKDLNENERKYAGLLKRSMEARLRSTERKEFLEELKANVSGWEDVADESREHLTGAFRLRRRVRKAVVEVCKSENRPVSDMWELAMESEFDLREKRDRKETVEVPNMTYEECQALVRANADRIWHQEFTFPEITVLPEKEKGKIQTLIEKKKAKAAVVLASLTFAAASLFSQVDKIQSSVESWWNSHRKDDNKVAAQPIDSSISISDNQVKKETVVTSTQVVTEVPVKPNVKKEQINKVELVREPEADYFVGQMNLKNTVSWKFPWNKEAFSGLQLTDPTSDMSSPEVIEIFEKWNEYPNAIAVYPTDGDAEVMLVHSFTDEKNNPLPANGAREGDWIGTTVTGYQDLNKDGLTTDLKIVKLATVTAEEFLKMAAIAKPGEEGYFRMDKLGLKDGEADLVMVTCDGKRTPDGDYDKRILVYLKTVDQKVNRKINPVSNSSVSYGENRNFLETAVQDELPTTNEELEQLVNEFAETYSPTSNVSLGKFIENNWYVFNKLNYKDSERKRIEAALRLLDTQTFKFGEKGKEQAIQCVGWASLMAAVNGQPEMVSGMGDYRYVAEMVPGDVQVLPGEWKLATNKYGVEMKYGFVPISQIKTGDVLITKKGEAGHVVYVEGKVTGADGNEYLMISEGNAGGKGKVSSSVLASEKDLIEFMGGAYAVI